MKAIQISFDEDLLREGARFQSESIEFAGVVYGHQQVLGIGQFVEELTLIATATEASEWAGRIAYLPL